MRYSTPEELRLWNFGLFFVKNLQIHTNETSLLSLCSNEDVAYNYRMLYAPLSHISNLVPHLFISGY